MRCDWPLCWYDSARKTDPDYVRNAEVFRTLKEKMVGKGMNKGK
jgi:hypothetical protein